MKLYYKEWIRIFIFYTVLTVLLSIFFYFGYNPKTCKQEICIIPIIVWIICTIYLLKYTKFKK